MSNIFGGIKGSKQRVSSRSESRPFFRSTGYSSWDEDSRRFTLDPSIRRIEDDALEKYASLYGDFGNASNRFLNQSSDLRSRVLGNQGSYLKAVLSPIRERFSALRGQTQQNLGLRGLSGSTFMNDTLSDIDSRASREESNAMALANQDLFRMEAGLNQAELDALNQAAAQRAAITGESLEVARARAARELGIFGLGSQTSGTQSGRSKSYEFGFGTPGGGGGAGTSGLCWVADELYGAGSDSAIKLRKFANAHLGENSSLGLFLDEYKKYGKKWAQMIQHDKKLRSFAKNLWDIMLKMSDKDGI